ncbi:unnamed protein product [Musa banksii]
MSIVRPKVEEGFNTDLQDHSKRQTIQKDVYDTTPHSVLRNRRLYLLPTAIGRPAGPSRDLENCLVSSGLISIGSDWSPSAIFSSSRLILLTWLWIRTCCSSPTPSCPPLTFRSSSPSIAACCSTRPRRRRRRRNVGFGCGVG